jgi:GNAT superfamily N-acetyltransferase
MATSQRPSGRIIRLSVSDRAVFRQHLGRLDAESLHNRFGMPVDAAFLDSYAAHCFDLGELVYGYVETGMLHAAAEMRRLAGPDEGDAELVFSVENEWRNRGIGSRLFGQMIGAARTRGIERLHMNCLAWNRPMQALARKFEAELHLEPGDIVGTVIAETGRFGSLGAAKAGDGFTTAVLGLPHRAHLNWRRLKEALRLSGRSPWRV